MVRGSYRLGAALLVCVTSVCGAQQPLSRPRISASADTNDARAYYAAGVAALQKDPKKAADAFQWATLIDPGYAETYYGRCHRRD